MPTPTKGPRLGAGPAHERLLLAGLATALFEHGRITTTAAKAKRLRPYAEHLITFAKRGDLHARRQVLRDIRDKSVVHTLFAEIGPRFAARSGGYTRITKVGARKGDKAPMAVIELVESLTVGQLAVGEAERARGTRFGRRRGAAAPAAAGRAAGPEPAPVTSEPAPAEVGSAEPPIDEGGADPPVDAGGAASVPAEGDVEGAAEPPGEQVAVPTEGGDTEVVTEAADAEPAEDASTAEGDADRA